MAKDEAFLGVDVEDPEAFARSLAARVLDATQLDCTVGIGENKLQAKIATGFGKPAGVFRLTFGNWFSVLGSLPTDALWGIGAKTARKLAGLGINTVSELAAADPDALAAVFGPMTGPWLVLLGRGRGDAEVDDSPYVGTGRGQLARASRRAGRKCKSEWRGSPGCSPRTWPPRSGPRCGWWSRYGTRRSLPRRTG